MLHYFLHFFLVLLAGCVSVSVQAQQTQADSLRKALTARMHDTTRMATMNRLGVAIYPTQPDSAIAWWKRSNHLADSLRGKYNGATLQKLLTLKGEALADIAFLYMNMGLTTPALEYNFMALRIRDSIHDLHGQAESLNNIAYEYCELGDTAQALVYYERSERKYDSIRDEGGVAYTYINRGRIYAAQKNDSAARAMYLAALELLDQSEDQHRGYSQCLNNLGTVELRAGRYDKAMQLILQGIAVRSAHNDRSGLAGSYISLGKLYDAMNVQDSAIYWAKAGYDLAVQTHSATQKSQGAQLLSILYAAQGDHEKALSFYKLHIQIRDSVASEESGKLMVRKQLGYEYAQKAAADSLAFINEQQLGEVRLSRQRGYTIGGFSALAVVAVLLFFVYRQRNAVTREKKKSDELLLNILPAETANELKLTGTAKTKEYSSVTVLFTDFRNFTKTAEQLSATELVALINTCYGAFDRIVAKHGVEKIKTIGDSYMCAGGIPVENTTHPQDVVRAALEMLRFIQEFNQARREQGLPFFEIRIGVHTGPVVAGIVGTRKFAYDIWGDTVNIASRMESSGEAGKVNISRQTYELIRNSGFSFEHRGKILAKNKGEIEMYFVQAG